MIWHQYDWTQYYLRSIKNTHFKKEILEIVGIQKVVWNLITMNFKSLSHRSKIVKLIYSSRKNMTLDLILNHVWFNLLLIKLKWKRIKLIWFNWILICSKLKRVEGDQRYITPLKSNLNKPLIRIKTSILLSIHLWNILYPNLSIYYIFIDLFDAFVKLIKSSIYL